MATESCAPSWRLDTANGSMAPRSAIEVLIDLNDKVAEGKVGEYQPIPLGFTPLDKTIGSPAYLTTRRLQIRVCPRSS